MNLRSIAIAGTALLAAACADTSNQILSPTTLENGPVAAFDASTSINALTPVVSATGSGCLAVDNGAIARSNARVAPCVSGAVNQLWIVPAVGTTDLMRVGDGMCLDAWGRSGAIGTEEGTWPCVAEAPNHQWTFTAAGELRGQNGYCATVTSDGSSTKLTLQVCTGAATQKWTVGGMDSGASSPAPAPIPTPVPAGTSTLLQSGTGTGCLAVDDVNQARSYARVAPCTPGAANQMWTPPATGLTDMVRVGNGMCLDAWGASGAIGTEEGTWPCVPSAPNHRWTYTAAGELRGQNGYCATVTGSGTTRITLQQCTGAATQKWTATTGASTTPTPAPAPAPTAAQFLVSGTGNGCLAIDDITLSRSNARLAACAAGASNQLWTTLAVGTSGLLRVGNGYCLDAWGASGAIGTEAGTWPCVPTAPNHQWVLTAAGELRGQYGYCATVTADGSRTKLTLQQCTGAATQKWTTTTTPPVTTPAPAPTPTPAPVPVPTPSPIPSPGLPFDAPSLPQAYVNTDPVAVTGRTIEVGQGGDLQGALDAAQPGDAIVLAAGATFTGNYVLPVKSGAAWITIRTSAIGSIPAAGQRMSPAYAAALPKIVTPNSQPALYAPPGSHHYRLIGLEVTASAGASGLNTLVWIGQGWPEQTSLAQVPHDLVLERLYVHGSATLNFRRCILMNSSWTAVIDSHVSECHSSSYDSQAIVGWNGPGPFKIVNNFLEGAGENIMFGGADPGISGLIPSDIEIRRNNFSKQLAWQGSSWIVKNLLEFKNARRVLIEGNVFENHWAAHQSGFAILWMAANAEGAAPWSTVSDITFQYNIVRKVAAGLNLKGLTGANVRAARFRIVHNVFEGIGDASLLPGGSTGRLLQIDGALAVEYSHNTGVGTTHGLLLIDEPQPNSLSMRNNIFGGGPVIASASGRGYGTQVLDYHVPGWQFAGNVILDAPTAWVTYPANNIYVSSLLAGLTNDLRVIGAPALGSATTDGLPPGADRATVDQRTAGVAR